MAIDAESLKQKQDKIKLLLERLDENLASGKITEAQYKQLYKKYSAEAESLKLEITEKSLMDEVGLEEKKEPARAVHTPKKAYAGRPLGITLIGAFSIILGVLSLTLLIEPVLEAVSYVKSNQLLYGQFNDVFLQFVLAVLESLGNHYGSTNYLLSVIAPVGIPVIFMGCGLLSLKPWALKIAKATAVILLLASNFSFLGFVFSGAILLYLFRPEVQDAFDASLLHQKNSKPAGLPIGIKILGGAFAVLAARNIIALLLFSGAQDINVFPSLSEYGIGPSATIFIFAAIQACLSYGILKLNDIAREGMIAIFTFSVVYTIFRFLNVPIGSINGSAYFSLIVPVATYILIIHYLISNKRLFRDDDTSIQKTVF